MARLPIHRSPLPFRAALVALAMLLLAAPAAHAGHRVVVGLGDQQAATFADPAFAWLRLRTARLVVPWSVQSIPYERQRVDEWLAAARRDHVQPVIAFGRVWTKRGARRLPSVAKYRRAFRRFRRAHPGVRVFIAWNEGNHRTQPTFRHPRAAARYFNALRHDCRRCTIVAGEVVDTDNMVGWIRRYKRALKYRPKVWGIHNYKDAFEYRYNTTKRFLALTRGQVWLTETGGIVRRPMAKTKRLSKKRRLAKAAHATDYILRQAKSHHRIRRVYLYQWRADPKAKWDSALVEKGGRFRPAFRVVARFLRRSIKQAPRRIRLRNRAAPNSRRT